MLFLPLMVCVSIFLQKRAYESCCLIHIFCLWISFLLLLIHMWIIFYTAQTRLLIFCACFSFILPRAMANITQRANPHRTVIFFIPRIV